MKEYSDDELKLRLKLLRDRVELKQRSGVNAYYDLILLEKISDEIRSRKNK